MTAPKVAVLTDADTVVALTPIRRDILESLASPGSATGVAASLGMSRQKANYHMRALEAVGLIELLEERPRRGLTERVMRRKAEVVLVDPLAFASSGLELSAAVGLSGVVATATDLIRQAAAVSMRAAASTGKVAAASMDTEIRVADPESMRRLLEDVAAVVARHDSPTGLRVRFAAAMLPGVDDR